MAILWSFGGTMKLGLRYEFGREIISICCNMDTGIDTPPGEILVDNEVNIEGRTGGCETARFTTRSGTRR